ncbi:MAG: hypothetical protein HYR90_02770 [Candidatus Andersenbacteria bacterium]|nr:hypothetical protein [Candidatus Andersenbacteria bacterium]MBI3251080.1 hypothetical protein [Candidatus Andersenbacteria bacterium]
MLDVIPSGASSYNPRPRRSRRRRSVPSPNVVQVEWKLPARLRKPVRQQFAQERAQRRRRQTVVQFQRRPLHTQALLAADRDSARTGNRVRKPTRRFFGDALSAQTSDVTEASRPQLQLAPPPYVGSFVASRPTQSKASSVSAPRLKKQKTLSYTTGERDIPITIGDGAPVQATNNEDLFVQVKPKRVAAGVTFSLWPGNWFQKQPAAKQPQTSKKKLISQY